MSVAGISHEDIVSVTNDFWSSMASLPLFSVESLPELTVNEEGILGHVEIRGAWTGMIELRASRSLAYAVASSLLDKSASQVKIEDAFDAIQEATNIIAGSIKRLLPSISKVAIPTMSGCSSLSSGTRCSKAQLAFFDSPDGQLAISVESKN